MRIVLPLIAVTLFLGCGGGAGLDDEGRKSVSGTVTLDGSPLASGDIALVDDSGDSVGVGTITNGAFTLSKSANVPGVPPGNYKVAVSSWKVRPGSVNDAGDIIEKGEEAIPLAYMDYKTSNLTVEVPSGGTSALQIELKSTGP